MSEVEVKFQGQSQSNKLWQGRSQILLITFLEGYNLKNAAMEWIKLKILYSLFQKMFNLWQFTILQKEGLTFYQWRNAQVWLLDSKQKDFSSTLKTSWFKMRIGVSVSILLQEAMILWQRIRNNETKLSTASTFFGSAFRMKVNDWYFWILWYIYHFKVCYLALLELFKASS